MHQVKAAAFPSRAVFFSSSPFSPYLEDPPARHWPAYEGSSANPHENRSMMRHAVATLRPYSAESATLSVSSSFERSLTELFDILCLPRQKFPRCHRPFAAMRGSQEGLQPTVWSVGSEVRHTVHRHFRFETGRIVKRHGGTQECFFSSISGCLNITWWRAEHTNVLSDTSSP